MQQQDPQADPHRSIRQFIWVGFWILLLIFLGLFFQAWIDKERNPNQYVQSRVDVDVREVVLTRNRYGYYYLNGYINGQQVEFLVDTGATDISIPEHIANKLKLNKLYEIEFYTANGRAKGYATKLASVRIGDIELNNLAASINPNVEDNTVLLGMSFLKQIEFSQRGDTLTLRQYPY